MFRIVVLAFAFSVSGCAVFEVGDLPKTTLAGPSDVSSPRPTLSYSLRAMTGGMNSSGESSESSRKTIDEDILSALQDSAMFDRIFAGNDPSDIHLDLVLTGDSNPAAMIPAFVTGLSFYTVPSWVTVDYELAATASRSDGMKRQYVVSDSHRLVQWAPMIFVFPFKNFSVVNDQRKNMIAKVLSDMDGDGFFSNAGSNAEVAVSDNRSLQKPDTSPWFKPDGRNSLSK